MRDSAQDWAAESRQYSASFALRKLGSHSTIA
jgi:hypothetical protein